MPITTEVQLYEYYLFYWGGVENENWIEKDLGITERNFWFNTAQDRSEFKARLKAVADAHKEIIAFAEYEGFDVRYKTIAEMVMVLPDGRRIPCRYDFGYGRDPENAHFMFHDGNWGCDCNKSLFLKEAGFDVEEMDCGDSIKLVDFKVVKEI